MGLLKKLFKKEQNEQKQQAVMKPVTPEQMHAIRYNVEFEVIPSAADYGISVAFMHDDYDAKILLSGIDNIPATYQVRKRIYHLDKGNIDIALFRFPEPEMSPETLFGAMVLDYDKPVKDYDNLHLPYYFLAKIKDMWMAGKVNEGVTTFQVQLDSPDVKQFMTWVLENENLTGCTALNNDLLSIIK